jgi:hypothetical protein
MDIGREHALSLRNGEEKEEEETWQEEEKVGVLEKGETYLPIQSFIHE